MANKENLQYKGINKPNFDVEVDTQNLLKELCSPDSVKELQKILLKMNGETFFSEPLFKKKYLFLMWEDLLAYQEPLGKIYRKSIAVCIAKKRTSSSKCHINDVMQHMSSKLSFLHLGGIPFDRSEKESYNQALVAAVKQFGLYPMPEVVGRKILAMCNCLCEKNTIKFPIVCICHPKNSKTEIILGSFSDKSRVSIQNRGQINKQEQLPTLSELKMYHLNGLPSSSSIETSVFTHYEFLEYEPDNVSSLKPVLGTSLSIHSQWSNVLGILEPLQSDCKTMVKVQAMTGDPLSGACNLHLELSQIEHFHKCLKGDRVMKEKSLPLILEKLKEFMIVEKPIQPAKFSSFSNIIVNQEIKNQERDLKPFDQIVMNRREHLDFTDRLWLILKDANSIAEIYDAFTIFYKDLADYMYAPGVFRENMSTIAEDIKKWIQPVMCPALDATVIFKLLIEIGVEKLRRDYMSIFIGLGLLTVDSLKQFFEPSILSEDAIKCLRKLHSILELTIVCIKRLSLPKTVLSKVISGALKQYENDKNTKLIQAFTFCIPPINARSLLNLMRPVLWELSLVTHDNERVKQSIHRFTTTATRNNIIAPEKYHPQMMLKTASYRYWQGIFIQQDVKE